MFAVLMFPAPTVRKGMDFFFTDFAAMPCLRSFARANAAEAARTSPEDLCPL